VDEVVQEVQRVQQTGELPVGWAVPTFECVHASNLVGTAHLTKIRHVVITGGEPMLLAEMMPLCERLHAAGLHITIETAGTLYLPVACDLMSISPKLASSTPSPESAGKWAERHERTRHQPDVIRRLLSAYDYQLKFVIDTPADCEAVHAWHTDFPEADKSHVLLMPQGTDQAALARIGNWLEPYCREHGFIFCPRKHIEWYGARRGT
jgi:7-carboxy-7-deazaguanine synthase